MAFSKLSYTAESRAMLTDIIDESQVVAVAEFPEDFQQILCDIILQEVRKSTYCVLTDVIVRRGKVADYVAEVSAVIADYWDAGDHRKADAYAEAMLRGDRFPPVIVDRPGGMLRDGYHRIAACVQIGSALVDVVYVYENAERFEDSLTVQDRRGVWSREGDTACGT